MEWAMKAKAASVVPTGTTTPATAMATARKLMRVTMKTNAGKAGATAMAATTRFMKAAMA
eukprot:CAMPEP_0168378404 /NCGR_PEP_ID=MMETSP0228-20121227/11320_1 /TAXON_ID=133427 /ORGANISM="Protoceratium reticulatum, Strain CCCM 535 (=CCMP 1889)" /LENGTH=59 /DNA_ID=CAMNT_0008391423 /DNA_START=57 /DNA_END=232 /DNA_ORIENTATION=+